MQIEMLRGSAPRNQRTNQLQQVRHLTEVIHPGWITEDELIRVDLKLKLNITVFINGRICPRISVLNSKDRARASSAREEKKPI